MGQTFKCKQCGDIIHSSLAHPNHRKPCTVCKAFEWELIGGPGYHMTPEGLRDDETGEYLLAGDYT